MNCDPNVAVLILGFSVGGMTLRAVIQLLKSKLKLTGFLALMLTFGCCAVAVIVYMLFTGFNWMCFLTYTLDVFAGTQVAHRIVKVNP